MRTPHILAVHLLLVRPDGAFLMSRRAHTGWMDGHWSLPAGHVEDGETALAAAIREANEELTISLASHQLALVHTMHRASDAPRVDLFFAATQWTGAITNNEPDRCDGLTWAKHDDLPDPVVPYIAQALEAWRAQIPYSAHGWPR